MVYARRTFSHSCLRKGNREYAFIPGLCGLPGIADEPITRRFCDYTAYFCGGRKKRVGYLLAIIGDSSIISQKVAPGNRLTRAGALAINNVYSQYKISPFLCPFVSELNNDCDIGMLIFRWNL